MAGGLRSEITLLKGVGKVRAAQFDRLGVHTVADLLYFYPRAYRNYADIYTLADAPDGKVCVKARLLYDAKIIETHGSATVVRAAATDGTDTVSLIWFNNKFVASEMKRGREMLFYGEIKARPNGGFEMTSPDFCTTEKGGYYHPVYRCTEGLTSKTVAACTEQAIDGYADLLPETFPPSLISKYRLPDIKTAVRYIHFPKNADELKNARRRLIFEELLVLSLGLKLTKLNGRTLTPFKTDRDFSDEFFSRLPFSPTSAQKRAVKECVTDMRSGSAMRRLVQGDVGSGKTAVAAAVIYSAVKNGMQAALMAPTEVLARQHKKTFDAFFDGTGITTEILTGSTSAKEKNRIKQGLADGSTDVVIGTHAVITDGVIFKSLGLAVTDEQHRFGVRQRTSLGEKGANPHVLVMSATPIPRTLSLVVYGDLDISVLDEKPAGRREVKTVRITSDKRKRMFGFIKKELDAGHQCFIVCPLAEEKTEENGTLPDGAERKTAPLVSAEKYYREISNGEFKNYKTALLHGKMTPKKKDEIMARFASGDIALLVCTVVIEVGIDVPNATVTAVENAERFGLSQLHQLRGRCGRGSENSCCILVSDSAGEIAEKRFDIMKKTNDGFLIAEEDLKLRGPGDFFGERQSGIPEMKIADLMTDSRILCAAKKEADEISAADPALSSPEHALIKREVQKLFANIGI